MKRLVLLFVLVMLFGINSSNAHPRRGGIDFNYFYGSLSPHGEWIEIDYDLYAWKPSYVSRRWAPYTEGRWVWTNHGWYWDSYEPFGWAVYHYGRWHFDDYYGWIWVPDYEWGPAWVEWRYDDDYIGWAPLPPYAVFRAGVGIHFTFDWHFPYHHWNYISVNHFCGYDVHHYIVKDHYKQRIHSRTKYRNDYDYRDGRVINRGIDRDFVERRGRTRITEARIEETTRLRNNSGLRSSRDKNRVEVYRPDVNEISRYRKLDKIEVKRSDRKSSLNVEKIEIGERSRDRKPEANRDRNIVRKSDNDVNEVRNRPVEKVSPAQPRGDAERKREEPRVVDSPSRYERPQVERESRPAESPKVEKRQPEVIDRTPRPESSPRMESGPVEKKREEKKAIERRSSEPRQAPEVRERRNEESRPAPAPREQKRESGSKERTRERR